MNNIVTNYKIEGIKILLDEKCILPRYYALIEYKYNLVTNLISLNCSTKEDCLRL